MVDIDSFSGLEVESENHVILKGRLKALETNTYGLFIIFLNENQRAVYNILAIASHYSSLYDIDPQLPWNTFEEKLADLKWKGDIALNISLDLQNYMDKALERDRGVELFTLLKNNDYMKIDSLLQAIFIKPFSDRNISMEIHVETISMEDFKKVNEERNQLKKQKPSTTTKLTEREGDQIEIDLILAPVSGILINELTKGDKIMVRILGNTTKARYYIDYFGVKVDGNIIPVPAEVIEINRNENNEFIILCKLAEKVYGRAVEAERVKLKRYEELLAHHPGDEDLSDLIKPLKERSFPVFAMIIGGLMFVVLIVFVIMWFNNIL